MRVGLCVSQDFAYWFSGSVTFDTGAHGRSYLGFSRHWSANISRSSRSSVRCIVQSEGA